MCTSILFINNGISYSEIYHFVSSLHLSNNVVCSCVRETNLLPDYLPKDVVVKTEVQVIIILIVKMSEGIKSRVKMLVSVSCTQSVGGCPRMPRLTEVSQISVKAKLRRRDVPKQAPERLDGEGRGVKPEISFLQLPHLYFRFNLKCTTEQVCRPTPACAEKRVIAVPACAEEHVITVLVFGDEHSRLW